MSKHVCVGNSHIFLNNFNNYSQTHKATQLDIKQSWRNTELPTTTNNVSGSSSFKRQSTLFGLLCFNDCVVQTFTGNNVGGQFS